MGPDDPKDPQNPSPTVTLEPDEAAEFLGMSNSLKIQASLPSASDAGIKVNIQDSAFTVKGIPLAAPRFNFKHEPDINITGFYVALKHSTFYFDVPIYEGPANSGPLGGDTLSVLVIDFQPEDVVFPYSIEVIIQPHGDDGLPLDEFERVITVEEPVGANLPGDPAKTCSILAPDPCPGQQPKNCGLPNWEWDFTYQEYNGFIFAPGIFAYAPVWIATGCCTNDGISLSTVNNPQCRPGSTNAEYKELPVTGTSTMRAFEILGLYDDGSFYRRYETSVQNIDLNKTDFCTEEIGYIHISHPRLGGGTHDFTEGLNSLVMTNNDDYTQGQVAFVHRGGDLIYTCHTLMFTEGLETKSSHIYRRYGGLSFKDFSPRFWD